MSEVPSHVYVIAEAGVNHNGNADWAEKLVEVAAEAGADAVKFQTFRAESLVTKTAAKAEYQKKLTGDQSQYEMLKALELTRENHLRLIEACKKKNITFLSTPFDEESAEFLNSLGMERFKIPSGEITNLPLLRKIASFKKPVILSTGMAEMSEVKAAVDVLLSHGVSRQDLVVLQCNTEYPTPFQDVNLRAMVSMKKELGLSVGYSDHTLGIEVSVAATALGAVVIEKHFTSDKNLPGPDHKVSLDPQELKNMVAAIRNVSAALGSEIKKPSESEFKNREPARRSLVAKNKISKGEPFTENNLAAKRPGNGVSPMRWDEALNRKASRDYSIDDPIQENEFKSKK